MQVDRAESQTCFVYNELVAGHKVPWF